MIKYTFNKRQYDDIDTLMNDIENELEIGDIYDEMLNSCGEVNICGHNYQASYALKEVDSTAYRCGKADYESNIVEEIKSEIEFLSGGDEYNQYNICVACEEFDDEENDE